jgi:predicted membrane-bound mannosyltransferase
VSVAREIPPPSARILPPLPTARFRAAVAVLTLLALTARAWTMTAQNLWYDEIETARIALLPLGDLLRGFRGELPLLPTAWLSPFYFLLLRAALLVRHVELETALRLVSVLAGAATVPALAWTARPLVGRHAALAATAILALSPFHLWYSQEVRPYALLALLGVLAIGFFHRALAAGRRAGWVGFAVTATLALYTHPTALALPAICGLTLVVAARRDSVTLRRGIATLAVVGTTFLPAVVMVRTRGANNIPDPPRSSARRR